MPLPKFVAWLIDTVRGSRQPAVATASLSTALMRKAGKPKPSSADRELVLSGRAPADLSVPSLDLSEVDEPFELPARLQCFELKLARSSVKSLPPGLRVAHRIDLTGCARLTHLPEGLKTGTLVLQDCTSLESLPEKLAVHFLVLDGCRALSQWPESARVTLGRASARNCARLASVPATLGPIASLDLSGCAAIRALPQGAQVTSWIDLHGTEVRTLPESLRDVRLRWRGVMISERVIFAPETLTAAEVLAEPNAEVRRVMLDRFGLDRFLTEARATIRDKDRDAGGERQLLAVDFPGDEPLVCVLVHCPSTSRRYLIRVLPTTQTCRAAVAWTAGFDKAEDYAPLQET